MANLPPDDDDLRDVLCADRAGFLFDHPCGRMARLRCGQCKRPICERHRHVVNRGAYCTACARQLAQPGSVAFVDSPYFYGRRHHRYFESYWLYDDEPDYGDYDDFTDADGASTQVEGDQTFENDVGAS